MVNTINLQPDPQLLDDEILEALVRPGGAIERLSDTAKAWLESREEHIHTDAIWSLIHVRYDADRARQLWDDVVRHRSELKEFLGRDVGLRVAAIDYFVNIARELGSPRVVHVEILEQLRNEATRDPLTGLGNRRVYREQLDIELARAGRHGSEFIVAMFDLDNFKGINDSQGHAAGDRILRQTGQIIQRSIRKTDLVTRWGGEEFVVLMPETGKSGGIEVAQRIRRGVETELGEQGVTISGGLAGFPVDGEDETSLFAFADRSLYRAKAEGKNRICAEPTERRRFLRLGGAYAVRVMEVDRGPALDATTTDISAGGFSFTTSSPPAISTLVSGSIQIDDHAVPFTGRAVYVEEKESEAYEVGVQFLDIAEEDRRKILSALEHEPVEVG